MTGDHIYAFDPHTKFVPLSTMAHPGRKWKSENLCQRFPDQMAPFKGKFGFKGGKFEHSLFRLPLRTQEMAKISEINNKFFSTDDLLREMHGMFTEAPLLVMFLKNLRKIHFGYFDGAKEHLIGEVDLQLRRETAHRKKALLEILRRPDFYNDIPTETFIYEGRIRERSPKGSFYQDYQFVECLGDQKINQWAKDEHDNNANICWLPLAGVAVAMPQRDDDGLWEMPRHSPHGSLSCFLPIPFASSGQELSVR